MQVITPITDMQVTVGRFTVGRACIVMTNTQDDALPVRAIVSAEDVRRIVTRSFQLSLWWFVVRSLLGMVPKDAPHGGDTGGATPQTTQTTQHPTPHPW